jgi:hypothetical protein
VGKVSGQLTAFAQHAAVVWISAYDALLYAEYCVHFIVADPPFSQ